jgi:hypothetical protein
MPIEIEWYHPYRVIYTRAWGVLTLDDMQQQSDGFVTLLSEGQIHMPGKLLYLIYDTLEVESMPPVYKLVKQALPVLRFKNRGPMFHITRNRTIRSIIELTAHITQFQLQSFATREEAIRALEAVMAKDELRAAGS